MIICKACGQRNGDADEFCASCGRYLEWSGEHVANPEPEAAAEPEEELPAQGERRPGIVARVRTSLGVAPRRPGEEPTSDGNGWQHVSEPGNGAAPAGTTPSRPEVAEPVLATAGAAAAHEAGSEVATAGEDAEGSPVTTGSVSHAPVAGAPVEVAEAVAGRPHGNEWDTFAVPIVRADPAVGSGQQPSGELATAHVSLLESAPAEGGSEGGEPTSRLSVVQPIPGTGSRRPGEALTVSGESIGPVRGSVLRQPTEASSTERLRRRQHPTSLVAVPDLPQVAGPGDVFCPRCGQFNASSRVFCRRCGEQLDLLDTEESYQRLTFRQRHWHRDVEIVTVGKRPGRWGRVTTGQSAGRFQRLSVRVGAVVIGALLLLSFLGPVAQPLKDWFHRTWSSVLNKVDIQYTQVFAIGANASSSAPNHLAGLAVDDAKNTWWQSAPNAKNGVGQTLTAVFAQKTPINRIGILSGAATQQTYLANTRPKEVLLTFSNGKRLREHLQDTQSFQHLVISETGITSVTMRILSVYPSPTKGHSVAVTELEFFERK
ncbi:MAG: hypothetical protein JWM85_3193 [Acidimicrobiaceae bacterium]|nr:hypothetical protein [Acidimicrobiaceae bacterium]